MRPSVAPGGSQVSRELAFSGLSCRPRLFRAVSGAAAVAAAVAARAKGGSVVPADKCVLRVNAVQLALGPEKEKNKADLL